MSIEKRQPNAMRFEKKSKHNKLIKNKKNPRPEKSVRKKKKNRKNELTTKRKNALMDE